MPRILATVFDLRRSWLTIVCAALLAGLVLTSAASAAASTSLQAKLSAARGQASAIAAELSQKQGEVAAAESRAAAASAREQQLSGLLATGRQRAALLANKVNRSRRHLALEKGRLRRARQALARRLVAMYESGSPSTASVVLASSSFDELGARSEYLAQIEDSDTALARRVEQVRNTVRRELSAVAALKDRVDAYNARLSAARSQIAAVRQNAEAAAAQLQSIAAAREASLSTLKSNIGQWVSEIQAARAAAAERATVAEAQAEVDRWLGGPYSIPSYIVMCESGGNYGAVNPSSGAGGAYQILPSTWQLYGGRGKPEDASKAEQDSIAAQIWADSGPSAWVCGG